MERSQVPELNKEDLLLKYSSNLSDSKAKNHYLSYARDFLDHADGLGRESIIRHMERLRRGNKKPGTINFAFRVIRRLFMVNGIEWPFSRGEAPQIGQRDENKPALDPELIKIMITAAKDGKLHEDEAAFLALSTVYGLRRQEMTNLRAGDVDLVNKTLFVATLKHGRERYHLIPPEIHPYLSAHDFNQIYSLTGMAQVFWRIVNNSGLGSLKTERLGFHAIRRSLLSGLIDNGLNPFATRAFMRWKGTAGELAMPARYYSNVVVGLEGRKVVSAEAKEDKEIFEKYHPFLPFFRS